jgi:hypothetical protein
VWGAARAGAILAVLVAALSVPFWGKAFHVDDPFFIAVAENVLRDPLRPFGGTVALDDTDHRVFDRAGAAPNTFETLSHPPLVPYAIAAASLPAGGIHERSQHAAFLAFSGLAAWAQYRLARRFTSAPLWAAVAFAACPPVVLAGHGLMTDLPALALALAAIALFVEGLDLEDDRRLLLAGVLAAAAVLTRYVWLGVVPLVGVWAVTRPRRGRAWVALLPFALVLAAWLVQNRAVHGAFHLTAGARHYAQYYEGRYLTTDDVGRRALSDLAALGGTLLPLAAFVAVRDRSRRALFRLTACAALAAALVHAASRVLPELADYGPSEAAALALFVGAALLLLASAAAAARDAEGRWLLAWLAGGLACTVVLLPFGAARYLLPVLPPLLLLCARPPEGGSAPAAGAGAWTAAAATGALALALAAADRQYADAYRAFAQDHLQAPGGARVWFIGDWGFRLYMERAGHRYLLSTSQAPVEGDLVIRPQIAGLHEMAPGLAARTERLATVEVPGGWPIRLMSHDARAGYYSHGWGLLPFAFSRAPLERFDVFRVARPGS